MITVLGHLNPDTDTTCSAIAYAWFLNEQGQEATAVRTGELNKETQYVLTHFELPTPELLSSLSSEHQIALVDTNNPEELLPGWEQAKLVSIIDHHKLVGGLSTPEPISITIEPVACTATLILSQMDQANVVPSKPIAGLMVSAILSDTLKFTSPTTTDVDKQAAERLAKIAGVEWQAWADELLAAKSDISDLSVSDLLMVDSKVFTLGSEKLRISVLETTNPSAVLAQQAELEAAMAGLKNDEDLTGAFLFVVDVLQSNAEVLTPSDHEKELVSKAFHTEFSGATVTLPGIVSRKKQIVPALEKALN